MEKATLCLPYTKFVRYTHMDSTSAYLVDRDTPVRFARQAIWAPHTGACEVLVWLVWFFLEINLANRCVPDALAVAAQPTASRHAHFWISLKEKDVRYEEKLVTFYALKSDTPAGPTAGLGNVQSMQFCFWCDFLFKLEAHTESAFTGATEVSNDTLCPRFPRPAKEKTLGIEPSAKTYKHLSYR